MNDYSIDLNVEIEKICKRLYLDICCIQRPLDDKSQLRIAVESEIMLGILYLVESKKIRLISSEVLEFEANKNVNMFRREFTYEVLGKADYFVIINDDIQNRAKDFVKAGIKSIDALHLASAEQSKVDYFCTCDDSFLKKAKKIDNINITLFSPIELLKEIEK
jgi:predicted nucleic acid-binding protein